VSKVDQKSMRNKRKLLFLVEWFYPGYRAGGPIQSCVNLCGALHDYFEIFVLTTDTDHGITESYKDIETGRWLFHPILNVHVYYTRRQTLKFTEIRSVIQQVQAEVIYLNLLFSPLFTLYPLWMKWRGLLPGRVVVCPRGTLYDSAITLKAWKKKPLLLIMRWMGLAHKVQFHATNKREKEAIRNYFPDAEITVADNLPSSGQPTFAPVVKLPGQVRCIFIARIVPIKNLLFLIESLQLVRAEVHLTIVGPVEDTSYWHLCQSAIAHLPNWIQVEYLGSKPSAELLPLLQQHQLFILPTLGENFGHSIFEALMAGRPVLISDQTPWQRLAVEKAGWDLPLLKCEDFSRVISMVADMEQSTYDEWANGAWQFANRFIRDNPQQQLYIELFS